MGDFTLEKERVLLNNKYDQLNVVQKKTANTVDKLERQQKYPTDCLNGFLIGLGIFDYRKYFKEPGRPSVKAPYAFYPEDCDKLIELFNMGDDTSFIRNWDYNKIIEKGIIDKNKLDILKKVVDLFVNLFEKYCNDKKILLEIKYHIEATTKIVMWETLDKLSDINKKISSLTNIDYSDINKTLISVAEYGIEEQDFLYWLNKLCDALDNFMNLWKKIQEKMIQNRDDEFKRNIFEQSEKEQDLIMDFINKYQKKLVEKKIITSQDNFRDATVIHTGKEYLKAQKNRSKIQNILQELSTEPGYKMYLEQTHKRRLSQEVFNEAQDYVKIVSLNPGLKNSKEYYESQMFSTEELIDFLLGLAPQKEKTDLNNDDLDN